MALVRMIRKKSGFDGGEVGVIHAQELQIEIPQQLFDSRRREGSFPHMAEKIAKSADVIKIPKILAKFKIDGCFSSELMAHGAKICSRIGFHTIVDEILGRRS